MIDQEPSYMYKRRWNPNDFRYEYRNFQTGGLFDNLKAFGKSALPSRKKMQSSAADFYKQQAFTKSKKAVDRMFSTEDTNFNKIRQTRPIRDGKKTILQRLRKKKDPVDQLSQKISKRLLLLDDE